MPGSRSELGENLISVAIPAYNEEMGIGETLKEVQTILDRIGQHYELIVVDDGSTDHTWQKIKNIALHDRRIKLIRFTRNFGKEAAILAALKYSRGDAVVVIDGDLEHPPEIIEKMVDIWEKEEVDVVHAVKQTRQRESILRKASAKLFYAAMKGFSGLDLRGATDYKLLDRKVVDQYLRMPENIRFFRGMIPWLGYRNTTVPFSPGIRKKGISRWSPLGLVRLGFRAICSFSALPLQVVTILGALVFVASVALGVQTLIMKLLGRAAPGFATVIILLLFIGSILMVSLGLIGQYLAMIYEEIKGRPAFVVETTLNL